MPEIHEVEILEAIQERVRSNTVTVRVTASEAVYITLAQNSQFEVGVLRQEVAELRAEVARLKSEINDLWSNVSS